MSANNFALLGEFYSTAEPYPLGMFLVSELSSVTTTAKKGVPYKEELYLFEAKNNPLKQDNIENMVEVFQTTNPVISVDWEDLINIESTQQLSEIVAVFEWD